MKIGTLVRLRKDMGWSVEGHGIGVVISRKGINPRGGGTIRSDVRLVSFPKLGVDEWRALHLLEVVA